MMIIDPPSPFAPIAEWEQFLREMQALKSNDVDVLNAIAEAKRVISEKQLEG